VLQKANGAFRGTCTFSIDYLTSHGHSGPAAAVVHQRRKPTAKETGIALLDPEDARMTIEFPEQFRKIMYMTP
jgi:hypothetical protein